MQYSVALQAAKVEVRRPIFFFFDNLPCDVCLFPFYFDFTIKRILKCSLVRHFEFPEKLRTSGRQNFI